MTMIELNVPEEVAQEVVEQYKQKEDRMENVLQSFRSNDLIDTDAYGKLENEKRDVVSHRRDVQKSINNQTEDDKDGLDELFGKN